MLESFLRCTGNYVEFGAGGSTCFAASLVTNSILAVDSSEEWLAMVRAECLARQYRIVPILVHADIGPTQDWGFPADHSAKARWNTYHEAIWSNPQASRADLFLIDGRFRVACFMQAAIRGRPGALIAMHDFAERPEYHVVREVAQEVAACESLSVFMRKPDYDPGRAVAILNERAFDPA